MPLAIFLLANSRGSEAICMLESSSVCWGSSIVAFSAVTDGSSPFDGIDVGHKSKPTLADLDGDGDLDLVVGEYDGSLNFWENVGLAALASFIAVTDGSSPFEGIDVGDGSTPTLADLDGDGDLDLVVGEYDGSLNFWENGLCTPDNACSNAGMCSSIYSSHPSCECLTGFSGGQCGSCLAGFYSPSCLVCPGGGTKSSLTPTLICSSRGSCDDGVLGTGGCSCAEHFSGATCSQGSCPAGTQYAYDAVVGYYQCSDCVAANSRTTRATTMIAKTAHRAISPTAPARRRARPAPQIRT